MLARGVDAVLEASVVGSFTRVGYALRRRLGHWPAPARLDGRVAVVTGATSGLGLAYAEGLAFLGASVRLIARDGVRAQRAREAIVRATGNPDVDFWLADMADPASVLDAVRACEDTFGRLDVLIHNAGTLAKDRSLNPQGVESTVATQLLGPFVMTERLMPLLEAASPGRVLLVSSGGMYAERFDLARLAEVAGPYDGVHTYARVKRAQLVLAGAWARSVNPRRTVFHALHPGWTDTPGLRSSLPSFYRVAKALLRTPAEGADTGLWLAGAPEALVRSGSFWHDRRPRAAHKVPWTRSQDPTGDQDRLVAWLGDLASRGVAGL